jgi:propanediol dehydratase large subunit
LDEERALGLRIRAVEALTAVFEELDLATVTTSMVQSVVFASGSDQTDSFTAGQITPISEAIKNRNITAVDVVARWPNVGFATRPKIFSSCSNSG